jgi:hypothetical protein
MSYADCTTVLVMQPVVHLSRPTHPDFAYSAGRSSGYLVDV